MMLLFQCIAKADTPFCTQLLHMVLLMILLQATLASDTPSMYSIIIMRYMLQTRVLLVMKLIERVTHCLINTLYLGGINFLVTFVQVEHM